MPEEFENISALLEGPESARINKLAGIVTNVVNIFVNAITSMEQRISAIEKRLDEIAAAISSGKPVSAPGAASASSEGGGVVKASLVSPSALKAQADSRPAPPGPGGSPPPRSGNIIFELKELFRRAKTE